MGTLADEITRRLEPLIGLRLTAARRAADMRTLQFGELRAVDRGSVGEYALHIQCPWRIEGPSGIVTGSTDLWEPSRPDEVDRDTWTYERGDSVQDERFRALLNERQDLLVQSVRGDDYGGASMRFAGGYQLVLFPAGARGEDWRILRPRSDERHFVIAGGTVEPPEA